METLQSAAADMMVARAEHLNFSRIDDSIVAIDKELGYCYAMNATTARVWELISSPVRVSSVCASLCGEFDVDPDVCLNDVVSILAEMKQNGLLRDVPA